MKFIDASKLAFLAVHMRHSLCRAELHSSIWQCTNSPQILSIHDYPFTVFIVSMFPHKIVKRIPIVCNTSKTRLSFIAEFWFVQNSSPNEYIRWQESLNPHEFVKGALVWFKIDPCILEKQWSSRPLAASASVLIERYFRHMGWNHESCTQTRKDIVSTASTQK